MPAARAHSGLVSAGAVLLCACGAARAAEGEGGDFFGDPGHAIIAVVVFVLLLAVVGRWGWKPIVEQLRRREESIAAALRESQERQRQAEELLKQYRAQLDQAQGEVKSLLAAARREASDAREQVLTDARHEARRAIDDASREIEQAKRDAVGELYDRTAQLATDIAAELIRRELSDQDHQRLVRASLDEIRKRADGSN